jgi:hypothetical protein
MLCRGERAATCVRSQLQVVRDMLAGPRSLADTGKRYARQYGPFILWLCVMHPEVWKDVPVHRESAGPSDGLGSPLPSDDNGAPREQVILLHLPVLCLSWFWVISWSVLAQVPWYSLIPGSIPEVAGCFFT